MRQTNMEYLVHAAKSHKEAKFGGEDKFVNAVVKSTELGLVIPSLLRANLEEAGFEVITDETKEGQKRQEMMGYKPLDFLTDVVVAKKVNRHESVLIAYGAAGDVQEAIIHAALGYVRERDVEHFGKILPNQFHKDPAPGEKVEVSDDARDISGQPLTDRHRKNLSAHFKARQEVIKAKNKKGGK